jgi:BTB/POZ domain
MSNPLKRARIESDGEATSPSGNSDASTSNMTRHPELWFDDGSVVLHVEKTLFRVHRSTLATHSTVFSDMFRIPQPPDQDAIEGCTVIKLPDSLDDVESLLKALYDPL